MTVSRVVNGASAVKPDTRAAVERAIAELGYTPNIVARRLAGGGALRFGLLYSNPSAFWLSEFLVGGLDAAQLQGIQLVVVKSTPGTNELTAARNLLTDGIDGLILPPPLCNHEPLLDMVRNSRVAAVAVASGLPVDGMASLGIDDFAAARTMTEHLLAIGHRRIGFIVGSPSQTASARRRDGFVAALAAAGIAAEPCLFAQGDFTYRSGLGGAEQLLGLRERPTAIFASNDDMAAATLAVADRMGLDVPHDLTVCGFDDTPLATLIWPALTTIRQPVAEMGNAAICMLADAITANRNGEGAKPFHRTFEFTLTRRDSDAAPRNERHQ